MEAASQPTTAPNLAPATDQAAHAADHGEVLPTIPATTLTAPVRIYSRADEPSEPPKTRRWLEATLIAG
jgi:hypothetical protein